MSQSFDAEIAGASSVVPDMVRDVMAYVQRNRFTFTRKEKPGLDGKVDIVTDVDEYAQQMYLRTLKLLLPKFGIIGEEEGLSVKCRIPGHDAYFTLDPIDGTEAFDRMQSHGIGTMLALVADGKVPCAAVGDICTGELYYYGSESPTAYRILPDRQHIPLGPHPTKGLAELNVLTGGRPSLMSDTLQYLTALPAKGGLFKEMEIDRGSIGIRMARLWKGEVGALILRPHFETPWDNTPLIGFCQKLGFKYLRQDKGTRRFVEYEPVLRKKPKDTKNETLVIHERHLPDLHAWEERLRA